MPAKKNWPIPPPPPDPENYILIRPRNGPPYWRRKKKEYKLNSVLTEWTRLTSIASHGARTIKSMLTPFLAGLDTGRIIAKMTAGLNKSYIENGSYDLLNLYDLDFQEEDKMGNLLRCEPDLEIRGHEMSIKVVASTHAVNKHNKQVTHFCYDAILIHGDPSKDTDLRIEHERSPLFDIYRQELTFHTMKLYMPAKATSWMFILKVGCYEKTIPEPHHVHYGMKVLAVGKTDGKTQEDVKGCMVR
jgi:hypothetical protein